MLPRWCMILAPALCMLLLGQAPPARTTTAPAPDNTSGVYPLWDGNESQEDYARRAGIEHVEIELSLDANTAMKLVLIPAGRFQAGDANSQRRVTISRPFYMSVTEVTQAQWDAVMKSNPSRFKGALLPVDDVTWEEAVQFCGELSRRTKRRVSLPTEAQWEHAYRAGTTTRYFSGDAFKSLQDYAWAAGNSGTPPVTKEVATRKPNPWGLCDIAGNVNEWCADWYDANYYVGGNTSNPTGPAKGVARVVRGGAVGNEKWCAAAFRKDVKADYRYGAASSLMIIGFRVVATLD